LNLVGTGRSAKPVVSPNPLNPSGVLFFSTQKVGPVRVTLFDVQGRYLRTLLELPEAPAGPQHVVIGAESSPGAARLGSGVYFYRVETADGATTGRFAVLK
jgi:hypothetical protein